MSGMLDLLWSYAGRAQTGDMTSLMMGGGNSQHRENTSNTKQMGRPFRPFKEPQNSTKRLSLGSYIGRVYYKGGTSSTKTYTFEKHLSQMPGANHASEIFSSYGDMRAAVRTRTWHKTLVRPAFLIFFWSTFPWRVSQVIWSFWSCRIEILQERKVCCLCSLGESREKCQNRCDCGNVPLYC